MVKKARHPEHMIAFEGARVLLRSPCVSRVVACECTSMEVGEFLSTRLFVEHGLMAIDGEGTGVHTVCGGRHVVVALPPLPFSQKTQPGRQVGLQRQWRGTHASNKYHLTTPHVTQSPAQDN